jgi:hypothetical protein
MARSARWSLHRLALVCLLAGGPATGTVVAAEMPFLRAPSTAPADDQAADWLISLLARQTLQKDALLAKLNLGVSVRGSMVTVWGNVDSSSQSRRAEDLIRQVPGVAQVRNELREASKDPTLQALARTAQPPKVLSAEAPQPSGLLTGWPTQGTAPAPPIVVSLRPPLMVEPPLPENVPAQPAPTTLIATIDQVRKADQRFRGVRADVKDGIVQLRGTVTRWEDMLELAEKIARLPGVERVILEEVRTPQKSTLSLP